MLLMPGSRAMEVERLLPVMLDAARLIKAQRPEIDFAMPRAVTISRKVLEEAIKASGLEIKLTEGNNYDIMSAADFAVATSGTVTLEAALCGLGCVILYRASALSYWIAKQVVEIPFIGLPNIVAGRSVEPELIQADCTPETVAKTTLKLLEPNRYALLQQDLREVRRRLGEPGAVRRVAELVLRMARPLIDQSSLPPGGAERIESKVAAHKPFCC